MPQPTSKARLVITALFVDHQTPAEVAARYGVHRAWVYKLKARYEAEGEAALEPRSRRPKTSPTALAGRGGRPDRAAAQGTDRRRPGRRPRDHRLAPRPPPRPPGVPVHHQPPPHRGRAGHPRAEEATEVLLHPVRSRRCPTRPGSPTSPTTGSPDPTADPGADVEIISWLDDCTRYALHVTAHHRITTPIVVTHVPRSPYPARDPRVHAHRQRHGLHRPTGRPRPPGGKQLLRSRAQPPPHRPEELPTQATPPPAARPSGSSRR